MSKPNEQRRTRSKYAKKVRRKVGKGKVDPRWMWWLERRSDGQ